LLAAATSKTTSVFSLTPFEDRLRHPSSWHSGVRFEGRWLAHDSTEIVLRPTHWLPAPADPPGFDQ
jgi:hypothetical protein